MYMYIRIYLISHRTEKPSMLAISSPARIDDSAASPPGSVLSTTNPACLFRFN